MMIAIGRLTPPRPRFKGENSRRTLSYASFAVNREIPRSIRPCTILAGGNAAASDRGQPAECPPPSSFVLLDYRFAPHANRRPRAEQALMPMIDDVAQTLVR